MNLSDLKSKTCQRSSAFCVNYFKFCTESDLWNLQSFFSLKFRQHSLEIVCIFQLCRIAKRAGAEVCCEDTHTWCVGSLGNCLITHRPRTSWYVQDSLNIVLERNGWPVGSSFSLPDCFVRRRNLMGGNYTFTCHSYDYIEMVWFAHHFLFQSALVGVSRDLRKQYRQKTARDTFFFSSKGLVVLVRCHHSPFNVIENLAVNWDFLILRYLNKRHYSLKFSFIIQSATQN